MGNKSGIARKQRETCGKKILADERSLSVCFLPPGARQIINFTLILSDLKG